MPTPPPPKEHRWRPGQSGNPSGRARGPSLAKALNRILELSPDDAESYKPERLIDVVAQSLVRRAIATDRGAVLAIRTILERTDGLPQQNIAITDDRTPFLHMDIDDLRSAAAEESARLNDLLAGVAVGVSNGNGNGNGNGR